LSTDEALAGGPTRSSCEIPARRGGSGAKGSAHQEPLMGQSRQWLRDDPVCCSTGHIVAGPGERSRMTGDCHVRICGSRGLRCPRLPDSGHVGTRKTCRNRSGGKSSRASLLRRRKSVRRHQNQAACGLAWDELGGCPVFWLSGVRRRGGVILVCCGCMEREKVSVDKSTGVAGSQGRGGRAPRQKP
jgi:hypothetical protein